MNIRGKKKEELQGVDLVVLSSFPQKTGKGYNVSIAARNDVFTQKDAKEGKAWAHPMLKNQVIKDKDGNTVTKDDGTPKYSNSIGLWDEQFKAIQEAAKGKEATVKGKDGQEYTQYPFKADIFVDKKKGHLMINSKTIAPATKKFNPDAHKKVTALANDYEKAHGSAERSTPEIAQEAEAEMQDVPEA